MSNASLVRGQRTYDRLDLFAMALLTVLCACWGLNQVAIKVVNSGISPTFQAFIRSAGGTLMVFAWCQARGIKLFERDGTLVPGIICGALFAAEFIFLNGALVHTTAARGVVILYLMPFVVAVGAHFLIPNDRLSVAKIIGLIAAFCGVLLVFGDKFSRAGGDALLGDGMMLLAAVFWGSTTLVIKTTALARARAEKTLILQLAVSAVILFASSVLQGEQGIFAPTPIVWSALAYQTLFVVPVTYLAWFWLMTQYPASQLSAFSFLTPLFGVLLGGLLLNEPVTPLLLLSLGFVAAGIYLVNRPRKV